MSRRLTPQYETPSQQSITADLNRLKDNNERNTERSSMESEHYYILEIVRPDIREARSCWGLDGICNINGISRVVSRKKMYVANVWKSGNEIRFVLSLTRLD